MIHKLSQRILGMTLVFLCTFVNAEIQVTDDQGRLIKLDSPARRIISLAPHITENLYTAGAGKYIVGAVDFSDHPKAALDLPRIGGYAKINIEAIIAAKPDLIIAWASGNPKIPVERLIELGLPVYYSQPDTAEKIIDNIKKFSVLADTQSAASPNLAHMRTVIHSLRQQYATKKKVSVLYQIWDKPLLTLNGQHVVSQIFKLCGANNIFSEEPTIAPRISIESVIISNPQLILLAENSQEQSDAWAKKWAKWPSINAVKNKQIFGINADTMNRPTLRFIDGARDVCELVDNTRQRLDTR